MAVIALAGCPVASFTFADAARDDSTAFDGRPPPPGDATSDAQVDGDSDGAGDGDGGRRAVVCTAGDAGPCYAVNRLAVSANHACVLLSNGRVRCWGDNSQMQVRAVAGPNSGVPIELQPVVNATDVAAGASFSCAIVSGATFPAQCWGSNAHGQLGDASPDAGVHNVAFVTEAIQQMRLGAGHACARVMSGGVWCWGDNSRGQCGLPVSTSSPDVMAPSQVLVGSLEAVGPLDSCGRSAVGGTLSCWGDDSYGQLGAGTIPPTMYDSTPRALTTIGSVVSAAFGDLHGCAVNERGELYCWGSNQEGQLGIGFSAVTRQLVPTRVAAMQTWRRVFAGTRGTCAEDAAGEFWCWGRNGAGQLAIDSGGMPIGTPTRAPALHGAEQLGLGFDHGCGLFADGEVRCWGYNSFGQLGVGTIDSAMNPLPTPQQVRW